MFFLVAYSGCARSFFYSKNLLKYVCFLRLDPELTETPDSAVGVPAYAIWNSQAPVWYTCLHYRRAVVYAIVFVDYANYMLLKLIRECYTHRFSPIKKRRV
jgi:hypothetical protein